MFDKEKRPVMYGAIRYLLKIVWLLAVDLIIVMYEGDTILVLLLIVLSVSIGIDGYLSGADREK